MKVTKRNGSIEDFDLSKIEKAVKKAYRSQGQEVSETILAELNYVFTRDYKDVTLSVEHIQDEVEKILQSYQWELNNQTVRNKIKDRADSICARVQANGGIQAYLNVMDDSNNTPDIIDNEMAILSTHIEPGRGMGKMVHELTLYRTGQMNSTILGE